MYCIVYIPGKYSDILLILFTFSYAIDHKTYILLRIVVCKQWATFLAKKRFIFKNFCFRRKQMPKFAISQRLWATTKIIVFIKRMFPLFKKKFTLT